LPTSAPLLFVDDDESVLFAVRDYFGQRGYVADAARTVAEADALLATHTYGLVVIDVQLGPTKEPVGLDLARRVHERYPATPIVIFTASGTPEIEDEAERCGAMFLAKPLSLKKFESVVDWVYRTYAGQGGHG
jgi:DNA-binding NtrC family response regulator